jgi:hypothetical protein
VIERIPALPLCLLLVFFECYMPSINEPQSAKFIGNLGDKALLVPKSEYGRRFPHGYQTYLRSHQGSRTPPVVVTECDFNWLHLVNTRSLPVGVVCARVHRNLRKYDRAGPG